MSVLVLSVDVYIAVVNDTLIDFVPSLVCDTVNVPLFEPVEAGKVLSSHATRDFE